MTAVAGRGSETYVPVPGEAVELAQVFDFLAAHERTDVGVVAQRYLLTGAVTGDQVEIPEEVHRVLRQVVDALAHGLVVTVAPQSTTLTSQQAADLLGVTRPTLVKMLDQGGLAFTRVGTHRRLLLSDVLAFRERRRVEQYAALEATAIDIDDEGDLESVLADLREARRVTAERRRVARS